MLCIYIHYSSFVTCYVLYLKTKRPSILNQSTLLYISFVDKSVCESRGTTVHYVYIYILTE